MRIEKSEPRRTKIGAAQILFGETSIRAKALLSNPKHMLLI
jgi:hypothetical protein